MDFGRYLVMVLLTVQGWWLLDGQSRWGSSPRQQVVVDPAQPLYQLRLGHNIGSDSALHAAALLFAEVVGRNSAGRVAVTVYPNQQLGNDHQMVEMLHPFGFILRCSLCLAIAISWFIWKNVICASSR